MATPLELAHIAIVTSEPVKACLNQLAATATDYFDNDTAKMEAWTWNGVTAVSDGGVFCELVGACGDKRIVWDSLVNADGTYALPKKEPTERQVTTVQ